MKVLLINIDSTIPNVALKKIEQYHTERGDEVIWDLPLWKHLADKIYVSCVFTWNKDKCKEWEGIAEIGGSGYDVKKVLPAEIELQKPKINIGFTTRGCIRKCQFCIVKDKEGKLVAVGDIYDFWDGQSKEIELLDNNILGLPAHFEKIWGQIRKEGLTVRENGLDIRLLNDWNAKILSSVKHKEYHFAYDNVGDKPAVEKGIETLLRNGIHKSTFYVLVGFNTTFTQDLERLNFLREKGQNAYVMRMRGCVKEKKYIALNMWANCHAAFNAMSFEQWCKTPDHKCYKDCYLET